MRRSREEEQLRMLIRETILHEGIWDSIKSGVGKIYDYIAGAADFKEPSSGIMKKLDDLSPDPVISSKRSHDSADAASRAPIPEGPTRVTDMISQRSRISLTGEMIEMMKLIERVLREEGFTDAGIAAAFANAWQESRFKADVVGDNGHSIGLFQLHDAGVGKGMSVEERQDPVLNTRKIADSARKSQFWDWMNSTDDPEILAAAFSKYVERPKDKEGNMRDRAETVRDFLDLEDTGSAGAMSV